MSSLLWRASLVCMLSATALLGAEPTQSAELVFCCRADNDLYLVATASGYRCARFDDANAALGHAAPASSLLILADGYPDTLTPVPSTFFEQTTRKNLRVYLEYPEAVPHLKLGPPRRPQWERAVVATDAFGDQLPAMRIMMVQGCRLLPTTCAEPWLVNARVAGFDRAVFGLPEERWPLLFELPEQNAIIATTKLSGFVTGRYAPRREWQILWGQLLGKLTQSPARELTLTAGVRPAYSKTEPLPADAEKRSLAAFCRWPIDARLLVHPSWQEDLTKRLLKNAATMPASDVPAGDGRCGVLEGFNSEIEWDGTQWRLPPLRCDCNAEMAACMALDAVINGNTASRQIAENLLDYICFTSEGMRAERGNPEHPAFGHVAWGVIAPLWRIANYGDDNGRVIEATLLAAACLKSDRWDEPMLRALLANLRTTGPLGFRMDRVDLGPLERFGWKHFAEAETFHPSPHYQASMWTCYLWAYRHTGYAPFLEQARRGISKTMEVYPEQWPWRNNPERVRMAHALAWLCRVDDQPKYRQWLVQMLDDLLACQDSETGAIREVIGTTGSGHYLSPTSNEEYGTREMPIIQDNTDSASDQLYVTGFTLLVLHEAQAVLKDAKYQAAEDKLADYLCRIQAWSETHPMFNGGWFRAFDFKRWEYWAGSGDAGWGAWSLETGWGQAWTAITFGLRAMNTTLWDVTARSKIAVHMPAVQQLMAVNKGGPWQPTTQPSTK